MFALPSSSSPPLRRGREGEGYSLPAPFSGLLTDVRFFEYIFIVFFLFFFVTESCGLLGIHGRLIPTHFFAAW